MWKLALFALSVHQAASTQLCSDVWDALCCSAHRLQNATSQNYVCPGSCTADDCCLAGPSSSTCSQSNNCLYTCAYPQSIVDPGGACDPQLNCTSSNCCRYATSCSEFQTISQGCAAGMFLDTSISCNGADCNSTTCCRYPTSCGEANANSVGVSPALCPALFLVYDPVLPCTSDCNTTGTCCRGPLNCTEVQPLYCPSRNGTLNTTVDCGTPCDPTTCCEPPATCHDFAQLPVAEQTCRGMGKLVLNDTTLFSLANCCVPPLTCQQANNLSNNVLQAQCLNQNQIFNNSYCGGTCNSTTCCIDFTNCDDWNSAFPGACSASGQLGTAGKSCVGVSCNVSTCCTPPTECDLYPCPAPLTPTGLGGGPCTPNCTQAVCCQLPTCAQQPGGHTCNGYFTYNGSKSCSLNASVPCDKNYCCAPWSSCADGFRFSLQCSASPKWFPAAEKPCSGAQCLNSTYCCVPPRSCLEYSVVNPSACSPLRRPLNTTTPCTELCDSVECCGQVNACSQYDPTVCQGFTGLVLNRTCPADCSRSTCCDPVQTCDKVTGQPWLNANCSARLQIVISSNTPVSSGCCRGPTDCSELGDTLYGNALCKGYGQNSLVPCSGANCSRAACCGFPVTCADQLASSPRFCTDSGLVNNPSATNANCVSQPCTRAQCCQAVTTCTEALAIAQQQNRDLCAGIGVPQSQSCTRCDAGEECCGPPQSCAAYFVRNVNACGNNLVRQYNACSGTSCNRTTCCSAPATCADVHKNVFCRAAGLWNDVNTANVSCGGNCTTSMCCRAISNCFEANEIAYTCPLGFIPEPYGEFIPCSGVSCNSDTCCRAPQVCSELLDFKYGTTCGTSAVPDELQADSQCNGACNTAQCCKSFMSCGDKLNADPHLCDNVGVPDPVPKCSGNACNTTTCCLPVQTCADALVAFPTLCLAASKLPDRTATTLDSSCGPTCKNNSALCCRAPQTCGEFQQVNPSFDCGPTARMLRDQTCTPSTCNTTVCCVPATTCGDVAEVVCTTTRPMFEYQNQQHTCPCNSTVCCKGFASCYDALQGLGSETTAALCSPDGIWSVAGGANCGAVLSCRSKCCKSRLTSAPSTAPSNAPSLANAPTESAPTPLAGCPDVEFTAFVRECRDGDFPATPNGPLDCSPRCVLAAKALYPQYTSPNMTETLFQACLETINNSTKGVLGIPPHFSPQTMTFLRAKFPGRGICQSVVNAAAQTVISSAALVLLMFV